MAERRQYGSGSIEAHGSGWRWVARIGGRRIKSRPYSTKGEAEAVLGEALRMSAAGDVAPVAALTLRQWGSQWLQRREASGVRSWRADRSRWGRHVQAASFIDMTLAAIRRRDLKRWIAELQQTGPAVQQFGGRFKRSGARLSPQTVRHCVNLVRGALAAAVDDELIDVNPADKLRVDSQPQTQEPWTHLNELEIGKLFTWLRAQKAPEMMVAVYAVAIYAGLRKGEVIPLRWVDVDLGERPQITVRYSRQGATKSGRIRRVPLLAQPAAALRAWAAAARGQSAAARLPTFVFPSTSGGRWNDDYEFRWPDKAKGRGCSTRGIKSRCGIDREVRFHDLRHTCASHLVMGSWGRAWRLEEVRDMLGHQDVETTQRYAHLSPDHLHAAAAATVRPPDLGITTPQIVPSEAGENSDSRQWALQDSNLRPLASEARVKALETQVLPSGLGPFRGLQGQAAEQLLGLVANGKPVPLELLDLLGVAEGPHALREAVRVARDLLLAGEHLSLRALPQQSD